MLHIYVNLDKSHPLGHLTYHKQKMNCKKICAHENLHSIASRRSADNKASMLNRELQASKTTRTTCTAEQRDLKEELH